MKVSKIENSFKSYDIVFEDDKKEFSIFFGGTLDLYFQLITKDAEIKEDPVINTFYITKENYQVYEAFLKLYDDIKNINIYEDSIDNDEEKKNCRLYNLHNYQELFNEEEETIIWYSDEVALEVASYLKIKKLNDSFKLEFITQKQKEGYDKTYCRNGFITIRFRNSGSRYEPFNIIFMRLFNSLQSIDDIKDNNHQYNIEEYLYQEKVKKIK